ncbi:MAG: UDP-N-acetylmuramoyl-L-alanyl-D-glutamate--2,6-diaminopimelate ligase [Candidatus Saccharimonadales bacterium]|jgi:UDP-N-acetylmuramoyl-L-alanyl-D-glutamate--2,6-diaminopimelate ligase
MTLRRFVKMFIPRRLFKKIEPYGHLGEAILFNCLYRFPGRRLKVIGVTGTNGKTTTCFLIHRLMREAGYNVGLMTTIAYGVGDDIKPQIHHMTNVTMPELMRRLSQFRQQKVEWLVLETTSQGLAQNRVWGIPFTIAVMTNVTHEHLDYHGTFTRYRDAKRKLFKLCNQNRRGQRTGIINADDPSAPLFAGDIVQPVTYGINHGDLKATNISLKAEGVTYQIKRKEGAVYSINCHLPGSFNVYNSLAAVSVGEILGLSRQQIEKGIDALKKVEGRMTKVDEGQSFTVIVDFAHTPDSFEKLFKDIRPTIQAKLLVVFGSAGRRDETKRAVQGELAGRFADTIIITEEDDRDADGQVIMQQIAEGAELAGKVIDKNMFLIHDRTEAIQYAVKLARKGDTLLILGKGHEKTIERADGEHPWDEISTAKQALKSLIKTTKN